MSNETQLFQWIKATDQMPTGINNKKINILYKGYAAVLVFLDGKWYWSDNSYNESKQNPVDESSWNVIEWLSPYTSSNEKGLYSIVNAMETIRAINRMDIKEVGKQFNQLSNQNIPDEIIENFMFTGLDNRDFLTSSYLQSRGFKNIYDISPTSTQQEEGEWKLIGHSYQIADTGDYDGYWEITNGKVSITTKDDDGDDNELLQKIVNALNESGCKFDLGDDVTADLYFQTLRNKDLENENQMLREALENLVQLKDWKDKNGKDEHYEKHQPLAWLKAKQSLNHS